jgi:hypothetical protein
LKDIEGIISELEQQREAIDRAITALREITSGGTRQATPTRAAASPQRKKRRLSPEGRERIAEALRKRWAAKRASKTLPAKKAASKQRTGQKGGRGRLRERPKRRLKPLDGSVLPSGGECIASGSILFPPAHDATMKNIYSVQE